MRKEIISRFSTECSRITQSHTQLGGLDQWAGGGGDPANYSESHNPERERINTSPINDVPIELLATAAELENSGWLVVMSAHLVGRR